MALDNQFGRWNQRVSHLHSLLDQVLRAWPPGTAVALPSTFTTLKDQVREQLDPDTSDVPVADDLAAAVAPITTAVRDFCELRSVAGGGPELRERLTHVRDVAQTVLTTLATEAAAAIQTVDQIVEEFEEEYRMTLLLALTANYAIGQKLIAWQAAKPKGKDAGDHLDVLTMELTSTSGERTVSLANLAAASTGAPSVGTSGRMREYVAEMQSGGTAPPIYRLAYGQWFTAIYTSWEDVYRERLAAAHSETTGESWSKNDIRSEFFNEIRLIRHDLQHKRGVCIESSDNTLIDWLVPGQQITPTVRQMVDLFGRFPADELRRAPTREKGDEDDAKDRLPYHFPKMWVERLRAHVEGIEQSRKKRPKVVQDALDAWMTGGSS